MLFLVYISMYTNVTKTEEVGTVYKIWNNYGIQLK